MNTNGLSLASRSRSLLAVAVVCVLAGAAGIAAAATAGPSAKKGVGTWHIDGAAAALSKVNVSWYYNWHSTDTFIGTPAEMTYVPMIWGAGNVTDTELAQAGKSGDTLLGFNEPDRADQANMTVRQALDLWPRLEATGMRLGSPAVASDGATDGSWLDWFMSTATSHDYRVDFIAIHWYGSDFGDGAVKQLAAYVDAVHDKYGLPIWLTEFALIRYNPSNPTLAAAEYPTQDQQAKFVASATQMLNGLPYVERYAWFALPTLDSGDDSGLYNTDGTLTAVGTAFQAVE